jgi:hypothetical protein
MIGTEPPQGAQSHTLKAILTTDYTDYTDGILEPFAQEVTEETESPILRSLSYLL